MPNKTFRLNPAVCAPYNADFDGDEMNLHIPQTEEARAEAEVLLQVKTQLISPRYGLSIIGCIQDAITGNYLLTKSMSMSREEAVELLLSVRETEISKLPTKQTVSGKEVFRVLLPSDFNFIGRSKAYTGNYEIDKKNDAMVVIEEGKLVSGVMDKANLGEGSGLLLRNLHKQYGKDKTIEILGKIFRLGIEVLLKVGFSVSISDMDLPELATTKIEDTLSKAYDEVNKLIKAFKEGKLEAFPGRSIEETLELRILEKLNEARNQTGNIISEYANKDTATLIMNASGARGNPLNLAQMAGCVGQQALRGKRIDKGFAGRTLSCFKRGDLDPDARGFIRNSFKKGLRPHEFFFAAMTGRDSLMDTALRTPKSGYLYRRLANAMQDLKVEYDNTVRDATKKIIQFEYGEDKIDVSKSENGKLNVRNIINSIV